MLLDPQFFTLAKAVHMITVTLTIAGFIVRSTWMLRNSPLLNARATKIFPHVNDTLLLLSALWTAAILGQYPFVDAWLTAKVAGLIVYILAGAVALTYGRTRKTRIAALALALLSFAYVVGVAVTKNPLLF
jgi:uncharacterized membrane protein SirB2